MLNHHFRLLAAMMCCVLAALLCAPAHAAQGGASGEVLRVALAGVKSPPKPAGAASQSPPTTKEEALAIAIATKPECFQWVSDRDKKRDVTVAFSETKGAVKSVKWSFTSASLPAVDPLNQGVVDAGLLFRRLHWLYLVKNLQDVGAQDFGVRLTMLDGQSSTVALGKQFGVQIESNENGYLYLFNITADGKVNLLYPKPGSAEKNYIAKNTPISRLMTVRGADGPEFLKAIVSQSPIPFDKLVGSDSDSVDQGAQIKEIRTRSGSTGARIGAAKLSFVTVDNAGAK